MPSSRASAGTPGERPAATLRPCQAGEFDAMLTIVNAAATAYRGVIPADCWHEPYMPAAELEAEMAAGVRFTGCEVAGALVGIMGLQSVRNVILIRHAYVLPAHQGCGLGTRLMSHLRAQSHRPILVGTWSAATWAIGFYERHGFELVPPGAKALLLSAYWRISDRQAETSVVLAAPPLTYDKAVALVQSAI